MEGKKLYIIDGYGQIFRSYYGFFTNPLTDKNGNNVSAIFGFFNTFMMILREYRPDYIAVAMDSHGPTFRDELYSEYKANRDAAPEDLISQIEEIKKMVDEFGIPHFEKRGLEADDMIASLCRIALSQGVESVLVTADKDLLQLVGPGVSALRPGSKGKDYRLFKDAEVKEAFGVLPSQIRDYLVILGDSSDNVPGIKGLGEKSAATLLDKYGTIDSIYEHKAELSPSVQAKLDAAADHIELTKALVSLKDDVLTQSDVDWPSMAVSSIDWAKAIERFRAIGSNVLVSSATRLAGSSPIKAAVPPVQPSLAPQITVNEVKSADELNELLSKGSLAETLALDIKCDGLIGELSFCWQDGVVYRLPSFDSFSSVLTRWLPSASIAAHDAKNLIKILGIKPEFDTMVAGWLLDSASDRYSIADLLDKFGLTSTGENASDVLLLKKTMAPMLAEKGLDSVMNDMEMPLLEVLADMESRGIILDPKRLTAFSEELIKSVGDLQDAICTLAGHEFNLNSTKQLSDVLFEERHLPPGPKTKNGFSTDAAVLENLAQTVDDPIVPLILRYRALSKLLSTYVLALPALINPETGRIHTSFLQTGTATGRLSSKNPNLQNIPIRTDEGRRIRDAFVPREGCILLSADYAQIELAVMAHFSKDDSMQRAFIDREDVHRRTAAEIFGIFPEMVTPSQRRVAKTINFGVIYGMSAFRLAGDLGINRKEAQSFIDAYFDRYSGIRTFIEDVKKSAARDGFVTTRKGHIRYIPEMRSSNKNVLAAAERAAVNTVIQGTAAEIVKDAMIAVHAEISRRGLSSRLLLQVHDELILEVPKQELEEVEQLVRSVMEGCPKLDVPLRVDIQTGATWGEMH